MPTRTGWLQKSWYNRTVCGRPPKKNRARRCVPDPAGLFLCGKHSGGLLGWVRLGRRSVPFAELSRTVSRLIPRAFLRHLQTVSSCSSGPYAVRKQQNYFFCRSRIAETTAFTSSALRPLVENVCVGSFFGPPLAT